MEVQRLLNDELNIKSELELLNVIVQKIISNLRWCTDRYTCLEEGGGGKASGGGFLLCCAVLCHCSCLSFALLKFICNNSFTRTLTHTHTHTHTHTRTHTHARNQLL